LTSTSPHCCDTTVSPFYEKRAAVYIIRLTIVYFWCHSSVGLYLPNLYILEF